MGRRRWTRWAWGCLAAQGLCGGFLAAEEPYPYSQDWWALRAQDPPGARQVEKDGKLWPPFPRPTGRSQHWVHKYHHAHYWPHPYNCEDQAYVRNLWDMQASAGWTTATTLHDYYFDADSQDLNSAGRQQLFWVVTTAPQQHRTVFVAQAASAEASQMRVANVERTIREFSPSSTPPVILRYEQFLGRPAQEIDQLRRLELQSMPRPRLFVVGVTRNSGGNMGGGGTNAGGTTGQPPGGGTSTR